MTFNPVSGTVLIGSIADLSDVLKRVPTQKISQIEKLLSHTWKPF